MSECQGWQASFYVVLGLPELLEDGGRFVERNVLVSLGCRCWGLEVLKRWS